MDADTLKKCTNIEKATDMHKRLLDENKGNGYLLFIDGIAGLKILGKE